MAALRPWAWAWACLALGAGATQPPACACSKAADWALDCAGRGRSALSLNDTCSGRTTKADLSNNRFAELPTHWDVHIVDANLSRNLLTALPQPPSLSVRTHTLDVSFNRIAQARSELRPLGALRTLAVSGNQLQALPFLPAPCRLLSLSADHNQLRTLQGPLNGCSKLERLDLSHNQLGSLPRGALAGLRSLQRLNLAKAGLSRIDAGAFDDLHNLQFLSLSANQLTTLPSRLCAHLKQLEEIHLDDNQIAFLPADVFSGMKNVEIISLARNKLSHLPEGIFSGLEKLKYIVLNENQIRSLPNRIFAGLSSLEGIGLPSNQLETLPRQVFSGLRSLQFVGLGVNKLSTLPAGLLEGIESLGMLDLGSNQLTNVPEGLLRGVKSIDILDLSYNRITTVSGADFAGSETIKVLELSGNRLERVPVLSPPWPRVEACFLEGNAVEAPEAALRSWLGDGALERSLVLGKRPPLRSVAGLRWALRERSVRAAVDADDCACGSLTRGRAEVLFCAAVACPRPLRDWMEALRTSQQHKG